MAKSSAHDYTGSKIVPVRIPDSMLVQIQVVLDRQAKYRHEGPMALGEFIKYCVAEVLAKPARSKACRIRKMAKKERHDGYGETI